jgi:hypothetical protein
MDGSTTFDCDWKTLASSVETKHLVFSGFNVPTLFPKFKKEDFSVKGTWYSPSMLPTKVHGQAFRTIA